MTDPDGYEPDPDDLKRSELADHNPMWAAVAGTLDDWLDQCHGIASSHHNAGAFLDLLALTGFEVVAKPTVPDLADLLPPATD